MDQEVHRLKRLLRQQQCPDRVLINIRDEIQRSRPRHRAKMNLPKIALFAGAVGSLLVMVLSWTPPRQPDLPSASSHSAPESAAVAEQTAISLAVIGHALLEAGNSTENALKTQTVPKLKKLREFLSKTI